MDTQQSTSELRELALFAGAGGGILGGKLLGWRTVCAVEIEPYAAGVLVARQNEGILAPFPIWDDVRTFDGNPWRGIVDVISGGFPCQDISSAGKGAGIDGERSGLWREFARIIGEVRPKYVLVENSPVLVRRGLGRVLGDLTRLGYNARWRPLSAQECGANHKRKRLWIMAYAKELFGNGCNDNAGIVLGSEAFPEFGDDGWKENVANSGCVHEQGIINQCTDEKERKEPCQRQVGSCGLGERESNWWEVEPDVGRVADGVAARVDRLKAIGNGQVPICMAKAFQLLSRGINK